MSNRTDEEQIALIRDWWRANGRSVIAGIVIAVVAVIGWQQWNAYQERTAESASGYYMAFLDALRDEAPEADLVEQGERIISDYGRTPYAALTALWLAQHHVERDELDAAADRLRWVVGQARSEAFVAPARLRLAQVLAAREQYDEALGLLEQAPAGFESRYRELAGDIQAERGSAEAAAAAYRQALEAPSLDPQRRGLIELKLSDMGVDLESLS